MRSIFLQAFEFLVQMFFAAFAHNRALLARYNVKPQELKALAQVSLMGKVTGTEALLFVLDAIRKAGNTDE